MSLRGLLVVSWLCCAVAGATATLLPAPAQAEQLTLAAAINQAGRQRMLTQRIVLSYCQVGLGVMTGASQRQLAEAIARFEQQLDRLDAFPATADVREAVARVRRIWEPFKAVAEAPPDREGAKRLLFWNDDLLYAANKVVGLLQDISDRPPARLVNLAGRQRMLSQRAAKFYMLQEWGFDSLRMRDQLEQARREFVAGLDALAAAPENTAEIARRLDNVAIQWTWFDNALTLRGDRSFRLVVVDSSETILLEMEALTALYERLAG